MHDAAAYHTILHSLLHAQCPHPLAFVPVCLLTCLLLLHQQEGAMGAQVAKRVKRLTKNMRNQLYRMGLTGDPSEGELKAGIARLRQMWAAQQAL
jgi:hypothetical protein